MSETSDARPSALVANADTGKCPVVRLKRDLRRAIKRGHPWIFADALKVRDAAGKLEPGAVVVVGDRSGRPVARGFYDPSGSLALRICTTRPSERLDDTWAASRMASAFALRASLAQDPDTTAYRLINGEGDQLPGLVCDIYADTAVIKLDGPIAERFWNAAGLAEHIAAATGVRRVYQRFRTRGQPSGRPLIGGAPDEAVSFVEHGRRFTADVVQGQKTGFFLDQRDNRRRVAALASGRDVLNVFGYTGGFSIYAGTGGARRVISVDIATPAIEASEAHWRLNGLDPALHEGVARDAFDYLGQLQASGERFGLVVLDPPAFASSRKSVDNAVKAYTRLAAAGAAVTEPGGLLVCASCSAHVGTQDFISACSDGIGKARRRATLLELHGQPMDHPAPLACPELRYLKCAFLRLDG